MSDVFISYKTEEMEEATWVKAMLETNGISCWMAPTSIPGGTSYATEIPRAIRGCRVLVLILSARAQGSQWVSREVDMAIGEGKVVLPFMLENCALKDDFNFYLTNVQRYAAYENKVAAAERMVREIQALVGESGTPAEDIPAPVAAAVPAAGGTDMLSLWSLLCGVAAAVALGGVLMVPNVAALVLSVLALRRRRGTGRAGIGMAVAGQILGQLTTVIGIAIWMTPYSLLFTLPVAAVSAVYFKKAYDGLVGGT